MTTPRALGVNQEQLIASGWTVPIIFITAHGEDDARTRAVERGAIDFLQKPEAHDRDAGHPLSDPYLLSRSIRDPRLTPRRRAASD